MATLTEITSSANELLASHSALIQEVRLSQQRNRDQLHLLSTPPQELLKLPLISSRPPSPARSDSSTSSPVQKTRELRPDLPPAKRARAARYTNYVPEEETIRNDYSQHYVDTGEWPQNWVLGTELEHRFEEYPKQQRLLALKTSAVAQHSSPPLYLPFSEFNTLQPCKFDVILLDPPYSSSFTWEHLQELPIPSLAGDPSYVFLWVGSGAGDGLERGREVLAKWGYRRCEDIVWVQTNKTTNKGPGTDPPTMSLFTRTKQHCLMGIRGTVRRSTDSWFVHCNVDTDVIFWEGDPSDPTRKPPEMYNMIESFCLGYRRLEVFGRQSSLRRGWVTVIDPNQEQNLRKTNDSSETIYVDGEDDTKALRWNRESWEQSVQERVTNGKTVVPTSTEIEALRPKSPVRGQSTNSTNNNPNQPNNPPAPMNNVSQFPIQQRTNFANPPGQIVNQNPMLHQPMMPMGVNALAMGMAPGMPIGVGVPMEEMMGGWNPVMGGMNMNMGPMGNMGNMGRMSGPGMNRMNMQMMQGMAMGGGFGGNAFNQGQFGGMEGGWEEGNMIGAGVNPMGNVMNMNMMGMGGQWGHNQGGF